MDELKKLYEEVNNELHKVHDEQRNAIDKSEDYLKDINVAYNYGKMQGLLFVWSRLREMLKE